MQKPSEEIALARLIGAIPMFGVSLCIAAVGMHNAQFGGLEDFPLLFAIPAVLFALAGERCLEIQEDNNG